MSAKVMTVLGPLDPVELGPTLMHEHIFIDQSCSFVHPEQASLLRFVDAPVEMPMLGMLRRQPLSLCHDNVVLSDEDVAVDELARFRRAGGGTVVDCTVIGLKRDPVAVQRVARATGLNIVQGTGVYIEVSHPDWVEAMNVTEMAEVFIQDIRVGIGDTSVRAGIIGEIGTSGVPKAGKENPPAKAEDIITRNEEKVLRAAGRASAATGAAVSVHLDPRKRGALRVVDILEEEGVTPHRMIMGHMDAVRDLAYHLAVAERGAFVEYDHIGREYYADNIGLAFGYDVDRIERLCGLLDAGYEDQVLISQDVCFKIDLRKYGGNGYDHILTSVLPMFRRAGITQEQIQKMLVENPTRALAFETES